MAKKSTDTTRDYGTSQLAQRFTVVPKLATLNSYHGKVIDDTEIDRLLMRDDITSAEHGMLISLHQKLRRGSFLSLQSPDLNASHQSADPSNIALKKAAALMTVTHLLAQMDRDIGKPQRMALVNLVLLDAPWPFPLDILRSSIRQLQDIFGR